MPSGKLVRQNAVKDDSDYEPEETSSTSSEEEEQTTTPQIQPKDLHELIELLQDRGGISLNNCQEVNMIRWAICEQIKKQENESVRDACLTLFDMTLNYANMFLLHYNKGKDKMKLTIDQFKNQKPNYEIPKNKDDY
tara:strand:- start:372 stop:782 length:411 start_codon:yes stop_codon:yes gene_type:complete